MPLPTTTDVFVNELLAEFAVAWIQDPGRFVATQVFPMMPVARQNGYYAELNQGDWNRIEARLRAPGTPMHRSGWRTDNTAEYKCQQYGITRAIPDEVRDNAHPAHEQDKSTAAWIMQQVLLKMESDWASAYFATSKGWTDVTVSAGDKWDESGADPIDQIMAQMDVIGRQYRRPNCLTLGLKAYRGLQNNPSVLDRIKYTGSATAPSMVTRQSLAALLGLDKVLVAEASYNSALEGATTSMGSICTETDALLTYSEPSPGLYTPTAGMTFVWTGRSGSGPQGQFFRQWRDEESLADVLEGSMTYDFKIVSAGLGAFFSGAANA